MTMTGLKRTTSADAGFRQLVTLLDADLAIRDGDEHSFYSQFNKIDALQQALVYYLDDQPVGCGAFKPLDDATAEVKRMFVLPAFRGRGIAVEILSALESWAAELGFNYCNLETGKKQPEAIRLYQKSGYELIPNYGPYADAENSVCFRKRLSAHN